jgi:hypothetical protein
MHEERTMRSEAEVDQVARKLRLLKNARKGDAPVLDVALLMLAWVRGDDTALSEVDRLARAAP